MAFNNLYLRVVTSLFLLLFLFSLIYYFETSIKWILIILYAIIVFETIFFFKNKKKNYIFLILYLIISLFCIELYIIYYYQKIIFFFFIFIIICFDTSSYILGSLYGNKKIIPNISPNKTFFGTIGGLLFTLSISLIFNYIFEIFIFVKAVIFIILMIVSAFIGDAIESFYKRTSNIKNSSNLLPGHGGIFDRFDSFLLGAIIILVFSYLHD